MHAQEAEESDKGMSRNLGGTEDNSGLNFDLIREQKRRLRQTALERRRSLPDRQERSLRIWERIFRIPEFHQAQTIACYVALPEEVQTEIGLRRILEEGKRLVVPYCRGSDLELCRIFSLDEISPGHWGIGEPKEELRQDPARKVVAEEVDLFLVPGVAFDRQGGRLGFGKGYFDRLLRRARQSACRVGICFACQLFDKLPQLPHDIRMNILVTEEETLYLIDLACENVF